MGEINLKVCDVKTTGEWGNTYNSGVSTEVSQGDSLCSSGHKENSLGMTSVCLTCSKENYQNAYRVQS